MSSDYSMRLAYGEALVQLGYDNDKVVVISADVSNSDHSFMFQETFPERFYNVGIAEQCLVDFAVGFAYCGKIPFANTFSFLFATRAVEMIRTHLCYGGANVKLMAAYAGLSDSFDGPTHHSISDIAIMRSLPNMTIVVPADAVSLKKLLPQIANWDGPVYCRLNRNAVPCIYEENITPEIGVAVEMREGRDVTILCCGIMLSRSLEAAKELEKKRISARVIEIHTIKPLDQAAIIKAARETGCLVTVEEHSVMGGLGSAVAEAVSDGWPVPIKRVGIPDCFSETGPYKQLLDAYGLSVEHIIRACLNAVDAKEKKS